MLVTAIKINIGDGRFYGSKDDFIRFKEGVLIKGFFSGTVGSLNKITGRKKDSVPENYYCSDYNNKTGFATFKFYSRTLVTDFPKGMLRYAGTNKSHVKLVFSN